MNKIKVNFGEDGVIVLQQTIDKQTTNRISLSRHEMESLISFLKHPSGAGYVIYGNQETPVTVRFDDVTFQYVIERETVQLVGFRVPRGVSPLRAEKQPPEPEPRPRSILRFIGF